MIKYTFASLGKLESVGLRVGGAGLGNILIPWATALVYAKKHKLLRIQTTWRTIKLGTFIRKERDKRMYLDLFTREEGVSGIRKFFLLNFSNQVKKFSSIANLFESFKDQHTFVRDELLQIVNPYHMKKVESFDSNSIALHIRMGDFLVSKDETLLRNGAWNYRIPLRWYISLIKKIRLITDLPVYIFSDGSDEDLADILKLDNCKRAYFGSAISDMIALSRSRLLIASGSTFSMWASFLGQTPTIWFPGQMRQALILNSNIFEGEIDYDEELPLNVKKVFNND